MRALCLIVMLLAAVCQGLTPGAESTVCTSNYREHLIKATARPQFSRAGFHIEPNFHSYANGQVHLQERGSLILVDPHHPVVSYPSCTHCDIRPVRVQFLAPRVYTSHLHVTATFTLYNIHTHHTTSYPVPVASMTGISTLHHGPMVATVNLAPGTQITHIKIDSPGQPYVIAEMHVCVHEAIAHYIEANAEHAPGATVPPYLSPVPGTAYVPTAFPTAAASTDSDGLSVGVYVGIATGCVLFIVGIVAILWYCLVFRRHGHVKMTSDGRIYTQAKRDA